MKLNINTLLTRRAKSNIVVMTQDWIVYGIMCLCTKMHLVCQDVLYVPGCTSCASMHFVRQDTLRALVHIICVSFPYFNLFDDALQCQFVC